MFRNLVVLVLFEHKQITPTCVLIIINYRPTHETIILKSPLQFSK